MRPHPRIRKTIKWGGAAVTVLLVVVWVGSARVAVVRTSPNGNTRGVSCGCFVSGTYVYQSADKAPLFATSWIAGDARWQFVWSFDRRYNVVPNFVVYTETTVPLWPFVVLGGIVAGIGWRRDWISERAADAVRDGRCSKCGYDRTGLVGGKDAKCPECGLGGAGPAGE